MHALAFSLLLLFANQKAEGFGARAVWAVRLEIASENIARMRAEPQTEVPAKMRVEDEPEIEVVVRLKGLGSFQPIDQKPSFTIKFGERGARGSPFGLEKIHLNNSAEDPSYLKEKIGTEMFRAAGFAAPESAHARVTLNGRSLGLYVLKEGITSEQRELKELAEAATEPNEDRRLQKLEAILDLKMFYKFMAMEVLMCHWDGYSLSQNNYDLLYNAELGRLQFLPSGMDQIFSKADLPWNPPMGGLVARSVMGTKRGQEAYEQTFRNVFETVFGAEALSNRVLESVAQLRPFLSKSEYKSLRNESKDLAANIARRKTSLREQLERPKTSPLTFVNGVATLSAWQRFNEPEGGRMTASRSKLRIIAGPKTSASWRATVLLKPGRYVFSAGAEARNLVPLPFGNRQGATLRVGGKDAQSASLTRSGREELRCEFTVEVEQEVVLACELRAAGGEVNFEKTAKLQAMKRN